MKSKQIIGLSCALCLAFSHLAFAAGLGDIGLFGGISQGTRLPKTTEVLLASTGKTKPAKPTPLPYKEVMFVNGQPQVFVGVLTSTIDTPAAGKTIGTYKENYKVTPSASTGTSNVLIRDITFSVNYRIEDNQTIKDYSLSKWAEAVTVGGKTMKIDNGLSKFEVSIIEDKTPGVNYYKGSLSERAVYTDGKSPDNNVTIDVAGTFYGENCAWSSTQVERLDGTVTTNDWQMQYQVRPSVSVNKVLNYSQNEPTEISFSGNYQEIMQNLSGLEYTIFAKPKEFYKIPDEGKVNVPGFNAVEQLIAPNTSYLKGNPAETDIKKLFAMQILNGDPKFYIPSQAITRDQFITAIAKAIKLPITPIDTSTKGKKTAVQTVVFPDVTQANQNYPYIMAAYKAGLAVGRSDGRFYSDSPIERQEAVAIILRAIGLENLGLDPTPITPFIDDSAIADWAKKEVYAALRLGIVSPDDNGKFSPKKIVSKAEAAALINRMVDYMRNDLATDYSEHIVNYAN